MCVFDWSTCDPLVLACCFLAFFPFLGGFFFGGVCLVLGVAFVFCLLLFSKGKATLALRLILMLMLTCGGCLLLRLRLLVSDWTMLREKEEVDEKERER